MKHPFFKSFLALSAALVVASCSEDTPSQPSSSLPDDLVVLGDCWVMDAGQTLLIYTNGIVADANGTPVGTFFGGDDLTGTIYLSDGTSITGVDLASLQTLAGPSSSSTADQPVPVTSSATVVTSSTTVPVSSTTITSSSTTVVASSSATVVKSSSSTATSSSSTQQSSTDGTCYDKASNSYVQPYASLKGSNGEQYAYDKSCTLNCYYDPAGKNCANISTSTATTSSSSTAKSSSSTAKSSSSTAKSSSSVASSSSTTSTSGGCPVIKTVSGGASGSGWATRYWDCCKPSCSWAENAGGNLARQCTTSGSLISDASSTSLCSGGNAATCVSQVPFTIDGCDTLGFAFAAVPASNGGQCGHCYELTFTGEGHYSSTNTNTKKLKTQNKKLIIMASNVGSDVSQGQFDVMIPGGGYGIFNGCANSMGWGDQGQQYGGLLSDCETSTNYTASKYASCLTTKCNSSFANDATAKAGCLFLANYLNAAGNPEHTYKEVECPDVLKNKY